MGGRVATKAREIGKRGGANDHQQRHAMPNDGVKLVLLVADAAIMGERDPAAPADSL